MELARMVTRMVDIDEQIRQASQREEAWRSSQLCESLMLAYYDFVYRLAVSLLHDEDDADDAAQETFMQAVLHIDQYQTGTNLKSWLAKIAVNHCLQKFRRQKVRRRLEEVLKLITLQMDPAAPSPENTLIHNERLYRIKRAVESLDEKHRIPVLLRYVHGLSLTEIAETLEISEGTVSSRLHYAVRKLRDRLGQFLEDLPDDERGVS